MFKNRIDAAEKLLPRLDKYKNSKSAILLAIPRGALELGAFLRDKLNLPLDIIVTKKISAPGNPEYAIGSVGPDGKTQINQAIIKLYGIPMAYVDKETARLTPMIQKRYEEYRGKTKMPDFKGKNVIILDDGIATGFTMLAAIQYIRSCDPAKIIVAVPVSANDSIEKIKALSDEVICLKVADDFQAVGQYYEHFSQVEDDEAIKLLGLKKI